jgi:uncharacterized protein YndB with AHSA1/START domain
MKPELAPIVRTVPVSWDPEAAFRRFTADFARWWPWPTHSIGGRERVERIVFECRAGGLIYEQHKDGRRFQWGRVLEWEPPRRVKFTWHPSRDPSTAQEVELRFHPEASGTRLELVSSGWENWGKGAKGARRGYDLGWWQVLNLFAGRRTLGMAVLGAMMRLVALVQRTRGGTAAAVARAGGEIGSASSR